MVGSCDSENYSSEKPKDTLPQGKLNHSRRQKYSNGAHSKCSKPAYDLLLNLEETETILALQYMVQTEETQCSNVTVGYAVLLCTIFETLPFPCACPASFQQNV